MPTNYAVHYEAAFSALQTVDVRKMVDEVDEPWCSRALVEVDDALVRLGVMEGEFHWHQHEQDEFFLVLDGQFNIELQGRETVELRNWQAFVVPARVRHRPVAPVRTSVIMVEKVGAVPAGD